MLPKHTGGHGFPSFLASGAAVAKSAVLSVSSNACKSNAPGAGKTASMKRASAHKKMIDFYIGEREKIEGVETK